jgi:hypothetical protein
MKYESAGGLRDVDRRSLTLRRNAPPEISITTGSPCLCQIPSHIIDDVTAAVRVGAVPPVLQWQYRRLVYHAHIYHPQVPLSTYGCSPNEFLGPTGLGSEDESNGLPNDTVYITHAVLTLSDDALTTNDPCSWNARKVKKAIRMARAGKFKSPTVSNTNELPAEQPFIASAVKIQSIVRGFATKKRVAKVLEKQRKNREKGKIRQQNKKKKGKKNKGSKKNVKSNLRTDGFENTDATL